MTPRQWLIQQRTERALELLEVSDLPIDEVSERSGFGTAVSLRQHFRDTLATTPSAYRRTFRGVTSPRAKVQSRSPKPGHAVLRLHPPLRMGLRGSVRGVRWCGRRRDGVIRVKMDRAENGTGED